MFIDFTEIKTLKIVPGLHVHTSIQCACNGLISLGGMVKQCRMYIIKTSEL